MAIEIVTFGDFDIKVDGQSVLKKSNRANKSLELLKYFITYRNKNLIPETIINDLWPDADLVDPKNVLRTQIFRWRKIIEEMGFTQNGDYACCLDIAFENGFYVFSPGDYCIIDADSFEQDIKKADFMRSRDQDKAIEIYMKVIDLYKGEYLGENTYLEWVFTIRSRYHRLFVQSLLRLLELLKNQRKFMEIIEVYEQTVVYEPFEESLHIFFLESLIELGEYKNALNHYKYITDKIYREMSICPTPALKNIYRKIFSSGDKNEGTDLAQVGTNLVNDDGIEGALFCDIDYFKTIYNLECRRKLRTDSQAFLGLFTIVQTKEDFITEIEKEDARKALKRVLFYSLRRGDVFSWWNPYQMIVLLTGLGEENLPLIQNRIINRFKNEINSDKFFLKTSFEPVTVKEFLIND